MIHDAVQFAVLIGYVALVAAAFAALKLAYAFVRSLLMFGWKATFSPQPKPGAGPWGWRR